MIPDPNDPVIKAAIKRADCDCAVGIADLEREAATAEEWSVGAAFNGSRNVDPKRARLNGMLNFLRGVR